LFSYSNFGHREENTPVKGKEKENKKRKVARRGPARLAEKLKAIRLGLGLSQNGMLQKLGFEDEYDRTEIAHYERGNREPTLPVLLAYARAANIFVEVLIDDSLDLPNEIPSKDSVF
jgi:DNA-binding XRE family transcriptional regulator